MRKPKKKKQKKTQIQRKKMLVARGEEWRDR